MLKRVHLWLLFGAFLGSAYVPLPSQAFEMRGLLGYDLPAYSSKPGAYQKSGGGVGYGFFGSLDLGPGNIESGFFYVPTSITWTVGSSNVTANGSYWLLPLMYRIPVVSPFLSAAVGADFAVLGNSSFWVAGNPVGSNGSGGYVGHFGAEGSIEAAQDLGENLSAILDLRYRQGIGDAISVSGHGSQFNFFMISIGIQKTLE